LSSPIVRDGSIGGGIPDIVAFRPVSPTVFVERAERLDTLASGHSVRGYLRFTSALSLAQATVLRSLSDLPVPDEQTLSHCREHGLPALAVDGHRREPVWHEIFRRLVEVLDSDAFPASGAAVMDELRGISAARLEAEAARLLAGVYAELDAAQAPFIGAALQAYWVKMALQLGSRATGDPAQIGQCPVCGSHPVASVLRIGGAQQGLRYLVCSLCCSEWHMVRVKCSACGSTKGISYFGVDGAGDAIKAECCDQCKTYLKIFYLEKDTRLVPAADDLASLALDMLVDEAGYNRLGPNLLFAPGRSAQ
jgi:FdhE protein